MGGENAVEIVRAGDEAAQPPARIPVRPHPCGVAEAEPAGARRRRRLGIDGDHLQEQGVAEAQEVVARAHLAVAAALRHGEAEAVPDMRHALREIGRDDDEVVEGEHRAGSA